MNNSTLIPLAAYASSKSALVTMSETLRMELSPFGVSVVTIMGGVISSNFDANNSDFSLPSDSRYGTIGEIIKGWATGTTKPPGSTPEQFAESCMKDIVGEGKNGLTWRGANASAVKFLVGYLPGFVLVSESPSYSPLIRHLSGKLMNSARTDL